MNMDPIAVECATCLAVAGEDCNTGFSKRAVSPHVARHRLARVGVGLPEVRSPGAGALPERRGKGAAAGPHRQEQRGLAPTPDPGARMCEVNYIVFAEQGLV